MDGCDTSSKWIPWTVLNFLSSDGSAQGERKQWAQGLMTKKFNAK